MMAARRGACAGMQDHSCAKTPFRRFAYDQLPHPIAACPIHAAGCLGSLPILPPGRTGYWGRLGSPVHTGSPSDRLSPQPEALDELQVAGVILSL